jgi:hypothetical protein
MTRAVDGNARTSFPFDAAPMCPRTISFAAAVACVLISSPRAQGNDLAAPLVALAADGEPAALLGAVFDGADVRLKRVATRSMSPEALRFADVVLVCLPEDVTGLDGKEQRAATPLGPLERWDRPTILIGAGAERIASNWGLPTPAEMAALEEGARGPEMQRMSPPEGAVTAVWRQGNVFRFMMQPEQIRGSAAESGWLRTVAANAARFAADQPIVRHPAPAGAELPEAEQQRRERVAANAKRLGIKISDLGDVMGVPDQMRGDTRMAAEELLHDLIADGLDTEISANNFGFHQRASFTPSFAGASP